MTDSPFARRTRLVGAALIAAISALSTSAHGQAPGAPGAPGAPEPSAISVSGLGEARVTPDRATATIGVETRRPTASQAAAENARQTRAVIEAIRAAGIAAEDITTNDYAVVPDYQYDQATRSSPLKGYFVRNTVRVRILKIENTGAVLDAALGKGANTIHSVELYSSTLQSARRDALANAVEQAKADAEVIAKAAGGTLGPLIELNSTEMVLPVLERVMAMRAMAAAPDSPTPIASGQQTVQARVAGRWRFLPGR